MNTDSWKVLIGPETDEMSWLVINVLELIPCSQEVVCASLVVHFSARLIRKHSKCFQNESTEKRRRHALWMMISLWLRDVLSNLRDGANWANSLIWVNRLARPRLWGRRVPPHAVLFDLFVPVFLSKPQGLNSALSKQRSVQWRREANKEYLVVKVLWRIYLKEKLNGILKGHSTESTHGYVYLTWGSMQLGVWKFVVVYQIQKKNLEGVHYG